MLVEQLAYASNHLVVRPADDAHRRMALAQIVDRLIQLPGVEVLLFDLLQRNGPLGVGDGRRVARKPTSPLPPPRHDRVG